MFLPNISLFPIFNLTHPTLILNFGEKMFLLNLSSDFQKKITKQNLVVNGHLYVYFIYIVTF